MKKYIYLVFSLIFFNCLFCYGVCPDADLDGDCRVGIVDAQMFASAWLEDGSSFANIDQSGIVNFNDFSILAHQWGRIGYKLLINEVMSDNSGTIEDPDEVGEYPDWVEVYNPGTNAVDIAGMYFTDDLSDSTQWQVPFGFSDITTIEPGGYLIIWADDDTEQGPLHTNFKLSASGESIGFYDPMGFMVDSISFGSLGTDESIGRYPNGAVGWQKFKNSAVTPGYSNGGVSTDAGILISEIMYNPEHNQEVFEPEPTELEYIEIYNRGSSLVDLTGWRFVDGIDYIFPEGTFIGGNSYLVIAADINAFNIKYSSVENCIGGWTGKLGNKGEKLSIVNSIGTVIDSVEYFDEGDWAQRSLGPVDHLHRGWIWSNDHDGFGSSLELICSDVSNEYGQNWKSSLINGGTPGSANSVSALDIAPIILDVEHKPLVPSSSDTVTVNVRVTDEDKSQVAVKLYWRLDVSTFSRYVYPVFDIDSYTVVDMYDDGVHDDAQHGDGLFAAQIEALADGSVIEFFVEVADITGKTRTWPSACEVDGDMVQLANMLYQVNDSFLMETKPKLGKQPVYYMVMTESERGRLAEIGDDGNDEAYSDAQMNATFISSDGVDMKCRYGVGVRNRGESSRKSPPNNYHINFRRDDKWEGVSAININSKYTHLQLAGSTIFQYAGLVGAEAVPVQIRVNGENLAVTDDKPDRMYGTYVRLEAIDSDFAKKHYPDDSGGNTYKASIYPQIADLTYRGTNPADYIARGYSKGTNSSESDWSDLFELTNVLDNEPDNTYLQRLEEVVNTDQWIRWYAVQALIGNKENGLSNGYGDDYRMYSGVIDPRFELVMHDMDTVLGFGDTAANINDSIWLMIASHTNVQMRVIERFLQNSAYVGKYYQQLKEVAETVYAPENINPMLDSVLDGFVPQAQIDGMKDFVADRRLSVLNQIPQDFSIISTLQIINGYRQSTSNFVTIRGFANAIDTRAVKINGLLGSYNGVTGQWSSISGISLNPGINRVVVQTFKDEQGFSDVLYEESIDIWYNDGDVSMLSGTITSDTVLSASNGPWQVAGELVVPVGVTLTIEPGCSLFFESGAGLTVNGKLISNGSEFARVSMTSVPGGSSWNGITFSNTDEDNQLEYVDISSGDAYGAMIDVVYSRVLIEHSNFEDSSKSMLSVIHPKLSINDSVFAGTDSICVLGQGFENDEYLTLNSNRFNVASGQFDVVKIDTSIGSKVYFRAYDNIFSGGGGNAIALNGVNGLIDGNTFSDFYKDTVRPNSSNAISITNCDAWISRNLFNYNDHAILLTDDANGHIGNNVFANSTISAIQFWEDNLSSSAAGSINFSGCIFAENVNVFSNDNLAALISINDSIIPVAMHGFGSGNIDADPLFIDDTSDFHLLSNSPAIGHGPYGMDMGRYIPQGAVIIGGPGPVTYENNAELTVDGLGITNYKWRLMENGLWSGEWSQEKGVASPIVLSGLQNTSSYQVFVKGRNIAGDWVGNIDGNASMEWTVENSSVKLILNEVLAENKTIAHQGTYPDMIEIYYSGSSPIDLGGYRLTDNDLIPDKFVFSSGTIMSSGDYLVVYADSNTTSGIHTGFEIDSDSDDIYLYNPSGEIVDSIKFGNQLNDKSIGRIGYNGKWSLNTPTFGSANISLPKGDFRSLKINEWMASSDILFTGDWVEIFNPSANPVDIGDFYLTDNIISKSQRTPISSLYFIEADSFAVIKAGQDGFDFNLSSNGEAIMLSDSEFNEIDKLVFGPQSTDLSQGRKPDGADNIEYFDLATPNASNANVYVETHADSLVLIDDVWSYNQSGVNLGTSWKMPWYNDSAWDSGAAILYWEGSSLPAPKNTPLTLGANTYYFRNSFTFDGELDDVDSLEFTMLIDDGALIYLNGNLILPIRLSANATYSTFASPAVGNASLEYYSVSPDYLINGENLLAVEVHQTSSTSSDIVFGLELTAKFTEKPIIQDQYANDRDVLAGLRVTEIMYNPGSNADSEYIELQNISNNVIELEGVRLSGGIDFIFPAMQLEPMEYVVVVFNQAVFEARYGTLVNVAGEYLGKLNNSGDDIVLKLAEPLDAAILRFSYNDAWLPSTDGQGASIVIADAMGERSSWDKKSGWISSVTGGGSPGRADTSSVIINEVLAHSHAMAPDWIELYNTTDEQINIGGWYLSDSDNDLKKYRIAPNTYIDSGDFIVFYEDLHFANPSDSGSLIQFGISENGESVYLSSAQDDEFDGYTVEVHFGASETGVSFGNYTKADSSVVFVSMQDITPDLPNSTAKVGPVIISEIMYNPVFGGQFPEDDYEYIELYNISDLGIVLDTYDASVNVTLGWKFISGVDYTFPIGTFIESGQKIIISRNPEAFLERYGDIGIDLYGPFESLSALSNSGENLELSKPGDVDIEGTRYYITVDSVRYDDQEPWPAGPDGDGKVLERINTQAYGDDASNWQSANLSPGV